MPSPATLIIGCGYLGHALARKLLEHAAASDTPRPIWATTRSETKARALFELGLRPALLHVTQPLTFASLRPALDHPAPLDVVYLVPPGRPSSRDAAAPTPRQTVVGGIATTLKQLRHAANLRRLVLASSTAVYGHQPCPPNAPLQAESPALADSPRARLLLDGETLWLNANDQPSFANTGAAFHVLRLAGIYGPGRVIGKRAVAEGHPLAGDPDAPLNLIHVDDAADALLAMLDPNRTPAPIELAADGHPIPRRDYYAAVAKHLGVDPPAALPPAAALDLGIDPARLKAASHKHLDPASTRDRLAWQPQHPNALNELPALIQPATP
ncbi:MAG: NAD-dependent epimerase/dehydratase family protein [Planctomycetota bacterium]